MTKNTCWCLLRIALFAIATTSARPAATAPISWVGGNADWDALVTKWNPNDEPDASDEAIFSVANTVTLANASESVMALTMSGGIDLLLNGNDMTVDGGNVTLSGAGTILDVPTNSLLNTDDTFVNAGASLALHGGTLTMVEAGADVGVLTVAVDGTVAGFGTINSNDGNLAANTTVLSLGGNLTVLTFDLFSQQAGTLSINVPVNGRVDLDQTDATIDITRNDTLDINGAAHDPAVDAYGGTMNLAEGATIDMGNAWGMNSGSINVSTHGINVNTAGAAATIAGGAFSQTGGAINLADNLDSLRFPADFTATGGSINNNGHVIFNNATINGADFQMNGANASLSVADSPDPGFHNVRITQGNFDLSGAGADTNVTTVGDGGFLWLEIDFDAGPIDVMDQSIELNGGGLRVHNVDDAIAGTDTVWHLNNGVVNVNLGANVLEGDDLIIQTETINVDPGAELNINTSKVEITNPTINVAGHLLINTISRWTNSNASVSGAGIFRPGVPAIGDGAIATDVEWNVTMIDWDDEAQVGAGNLGTTIRAGSSLTINADAIETDPDDGYDATITIDSADLTVNTPGAWRMERVLNIDNLSAIPAINGARMIVADANGATVNVGANGGVGVHNMNAPLTLEANGVVDVAGTAIFQVSGDTVFEGGQVTGDGIYLPAATNTVNDSPSVSRIDVRGFDFERGSWTINPNATLLVDVEDYDSNSVTNDFSSTITIGEHATLSMHSGDPAFVVDAATINMIGSLGGVSTSWQGDPIEFGNDAGVLDTHLVVSGDHSFISAQMTFFSDADVTIDAGSTLAITGAFTIFNSVNGLNNASFTGNGELAFNTVLTFNETTTLDVSTVHLKQGNPFGRTVTINANTTINADAMGAFGDVNDDGNDDFLVLNDQARLAVNLSNPDSEWSINSPAIVNINASEAPLVGSGIDGADVNVNGTVNVSGNSVWNARVDIAGTINTTLASDRFQLNGGGGSDRNRMEGGTINGPGQLVLDSGHSLAGHGTINSDISFLNNSTRVAADDGVLTINGDFLGFPAGSTGTEDADGILNVVNPWDSLIFVSVTLNGGEIRGGTITNNTRIEGFGLISARVINNSSIRAQAGGTLVLETVGNDNDWDGVNDFALLFALGGNLELRDNASFPFGGRVWAQTGREVFANGFELEFEPGSELALDGGAYRSTDATDIGGLVTIGAGTATMQIVGITAFESTSSTTLTGNLQIDNAATRIDAGATFTGAGTLINLANRTLTLADGAEVNVSFKNDGALAIGASAGHTQGLSFQQTAIGTWQVDLGGTEINHFDRMELTGAAALDGTLALSLLLPYEPSLGDTMQILSAAGGLGATTFSNVSQPPDMPSHFAFDVVYNPTNVQVIVVSALPGDYNRNGVVDAADFTVWRDHLGETLSLFNENIAATTPGLVDQEDYDFWRANFGSSIVANAEALANASIPESTSLLLATIAASYVWMIKMPPGPCRKHQSRQV